MYSDANYHFGKRASQPLQKKVKTKVFYLMAKPAPASASNLSIVEYMVRCTHQDPSRAPIQYEEVLYRTGYFEWLSYGNPNPLKYGFIE